MGVYFRDFHELMFSSCTVHVCGAPFLETTHLYRQYNGFTHFLVVLRGGQSKERRGGCLHTSSRLRREACLLFVPEILQTDQSIKLNASGSKESR